MSRLDKSTISENKNITSNTRGEHEQGFCRGAITSKSVRTPEKPVNMDRSCSYFT